MQTMQIRSSPKAPVGVVIRRQTSSSSKSGWFRRKRNRSLQAHSSGRARMRPVCFRPSTDPDPRSKIQVPPAYRSEMRGWVDLASCILYLASCISSNTDMNAGARGDLGTFATLLCLNWCHAKNTASLQTASDCSPHCPCRRRGLGCLCSQVFVAVGRSRR